MSFVDKLQTQTAKTQQCLFCPDCICRPSKLSNALNLEDGLDNWYEDHMASHENFLFSCNICKKSSFGPPLFITFAEAKLHLSAIHKLDSHDVINENVVFPVDFRRAKCRSCNQEVLCTGRRTVIRHMLDHNYEPGLVSISNVDFLLGCRLCPFVTSNWNLWSDHFSQLSRYLCEGSMIKRKSREKRSVPQSSESRSEPVKKKTGLFFCSLCCITFCDAAPLQDHYTGVEHARMMFRTRPILPLLCCFCKVDVRFSEFSNHIRSKEHSEALRSLVLFGTANTSADTSVSEKTQIDKKKNVPKDQMDENENVEKEIEEIQVVASPVVKTATGSQLKTGSSRKLQCLFCDVFQVDDFESHIVQKHRGNLFFCTKCPDEATIYMEALLPHMEEQHSGANVEVSLPANLMFHICLSCHKRGNTLEGAHVEKFLVFGRDPHHKCHGSGNQAQIPLYVECRICNSIFNRIPDYFFHPCYATLKGHNKIGINFLLKLKEKFRKNSVAYK